MQICLRVLLNEIDDLKQGTVSKDHMDVRERVVDGIELDLEKLQVGFNCLSL